MAGKVGAPYGNKNAAGSHGGGVNYNSAKFLKAARRQARGPGGGAAAKFLKNRNSSASKFIKPF